MNSCSRRYQIKADFRLLLHMGVTKEFVAKMLLLQGKVRPAKKLLIEAKQCFQQCKVSPLLSPLRKIINSPRSGEKIYIVF